MIKNIEAFKKRGKKIVTFSGSFDILHIGHIKALQEAKNQGDILIVLLNSDKSIRKYKGFLHPINSQDKRVKMLSALKMVDHILIFDELTPIKILSKIKPDIHCNGSDWGQDCIEKETVEKGGGKIYILKWNKGFSTTKLVKKILASYSKPEIKAVFLNSKLPVPKKLSESNYKIIALTDKPVQNFGLNLSKSWIIGQSEKDVIMGKMANARTILIGQKSKIKPNYYVKNLSQAIKIILSS